ncbi:putative baseplate assembly protein [Actinophytocola algeriensis]|uniref:Putative phage baseplate assembly protein n=1 Tax=Actinophytocola algeriensis TaxID=1768010 RepID=A0A7W7QAX0_9PSEU|nr:putative baseplate assembly protein [Actinophytocola algeriensis]MBB4910210.1 putative phage baseplate assembly protein [Actinophytocola algeriensis]MBE1480801.1 putative phage baseplate assembly protein [Actinophytocola algeriensis]
MALPAPNLDDRRFQDLVDDAKRMVMRRCPEWTDHNVSDPGVTLIETFAFMTDQLLFRLNQVPDRLYVKFLELIGLRLIPATPAQADVTFWLSAPAITPVGVAMGTNVATLRTETDESVVFATGADLRIVPCALNFVATRAADADAQVDRTDELKMGQSFQAFSAVPRSGDTVLVGLSDPVPNCVVRLDLDCRVEGVGVHPDHPPLVWEAWNGKEWRKCVVSTDGTGALNTAGEIHLHVPADHESAVLGGNAAGWLRARVIEVAEDWPTYQASPLVTALSASTIGGTVEANHCEIVEEEVLGDSEGVPGQEFRTTRRPIVIGAGETVLETTSEEGWQEWTQVHNFAGSDPSDRHYLLDGTSGTVHFGPVIREPDGGLRQYGAVPPYGSTVRLRKYATGGGRVGNVGKGAIQTLKSSIPFVSRVENIEAAWGGVDGESVDEAKARGPILLRTRSRAVTAEDYEAITQEAAPDVARVRCVTAGDEDTDPGSVRVLIVPAAAEVEGRIDFAELVPEEETLRRISERLDEVRLIGTRVLVSPPKYRGVTVVARVIARPRLDKARVRADALAALYEYLNPISGGRDGRGWDFGRPVQSGDVYALLQRVRGVDLVEDVRLFGANPVTGERGEECQRLDVDRHSLIFSFEHHVRVEDH